MKVWVLEQDQWNCDGYKRLITEVWMCKSAADKRLFELKFENRDEVWGSWFRYRLIESKMC